MVEKQQPHTHTLITQAPDNNNRVHAHPITVSDFIRNPDDTLTLITCACACVFCARLCNTILMCTKVKRKPLHDDASEPNKWVPHTIHVLTKIEIAANRARARARLSACVCVCVLWNAEFETLTRTGIRKFSHTTYAFACRAISTPIIIKRRRGAALTTV